MQYFGQREQNMTINIHEAKIMAVDLVNGQADEEVVMAGANHGAYLIMDDIFEVIEVTEPGSDNIWKRFYLPEYIDGILFAASKQAEEAAKPNDDRFASVVAGYTMQIMGASRQVSQFQQLLNKPSVEFYGPPVGFYSG